MALHGDRVLPRYHRGRLPPRCPHLRELNGDRLIDYSRIDFRLSREFQAKKPTSCLSGRLQPAEPGERPGAQPRRGDLRGAPLRAARDRSAGGGHALLASSGTSGLRPWISLRPKKPVGDGGRETVERSQTPFFRTAYRTLPVLHLLTLGLGRSYTDVRDLFQDMAGGVSPFRTAFESHMGIGLTELEEGFFERIRAYLDSNR
jgi:hypothetical protein